MWDKFEFTVDASGDHVRALFYVNDVLVLKTKRSHGSGKIDGNVRHFIRQQMKLNEAQFTLAIDCPLTRAEYLQILGAKGLLTPPPNESPGSGRSG